MTPAITLAATTPLIKTASFRDVEPVINTMVLAFNADPVARWLYPDPRQYLQIFPNFVKAFGGQAFTQKTAYYIDGYAGAALWLPPQIDPDSEMVMTLLQHTVSNSQQTDVFAVLAQMGTYHPSEPHWYLSVLGVEPLHQKKGYGGALLQPITMLCDRTDTIAYLECSNPTNVSFYEHHGFEVLGEIQVGQSPLITPMIRYPRFLA